MVVKNIRERLVGGTGSLSGAASIMGSWQVCHSLCLGIIALLGAIGITIVGMPLLFFTKIALPMWLIAAGLFGVILYFYFRKHCISKNLLLFNSGLIIAGTPFQSVQQFQVWFWIVGSIFAVFGVTFYIKTKIIQKQLARRKNA